MRKDASRASRVGSDQKYTRWGFMKAAALGAAAASAVGIGRRAGAEGQGTAVGGQGAVGAAATEARAPIVLSSNSLYDGFG